jgi:hypothetical protein
MWQQALINVGPTGVDKGKGGKFLLLPPDYKAEPPAGYFVAKSPTYGVWFGVRGLLVNGKADQAIALMKTMRTYPLAKADDPPAMSFLNGSGKVIDTIFPDTYEYFESLANLVEKEPVDAIPPSERFLLASIGIEKGKAFMPDTKTKQLLAEAARAGAAMARVNTFAARDPMAGPVAPPVFKTGLAANIVAGGFDSLPPPPLPLSIARAFSGERQLVAQRRAHVVSNLADGPARFAFRSDRIAAVHEDTNNRAGERTIASPDRLTLSTASAQFPSFLF